MGTNITIGKESPLIHKLAEISAKLDKIEKRGHNERHKYDYVRATDVMDAARREFLDNKLLLLPCVDGCQVHEAEDGQILTTIELRFEIRDVDTGESIFLHWAGQGADMSDKGLYKAITGGLKYFLLNLFLIPTGDDPESDNVEEEVEEAPRRKPAPKIPKDRAKNILKMAQACGLADGRGTKTTLKAKLQSLGIDTGKIVDLDVDTAETVEVFLRAEKK